MRFIELQNVGWNAITLAFLATAFFGFYGAYGLVKQIQKVRREGAGSVSVAWTLTFGAMFTAYLPYAALSGKLALIVQAALRVPFYFVLIPLLWEKKGGFTKEEWLLSAGLAVAIVYSAIDAPNVFLGLSWFGALVAADQPWQICRKQDVGAVSIDLLVAYEASAAFWLIYGYLTFDTYIEAYAAAFLVVYTTTLAVYWWYRPTPDAP